MRCNLFVNNNNNNSKEKNSQYIIQTNNQLKVFPRLKIH